MRFRTLCGALTLLLFVAPLSASFCGNCDPGHCRMTGTSEMSDSSEAQAETHCDEAEESKEETAPCHDAAPASTSLDCCSMTAAPEPAPAAAPAGPVVFEIALEAALDAGLPAAVEHDRSEDRRQQPPRQLPQQLYTLHNAFLI